MSGSTRSYEMAKRLVDHGHEVFMITSWRETLPNQKTFESIEAGIKVFWLPVSYSNKMNFFERIKAFFTFALKASKKAIELDGDVVFATSTPLTICIPGIISSKAKNIPMVFEVRDLWPEVPLAMGIISNPFLKLFSKLLEKIAYFNSERIVALSPGMAEGVISTGYPKNRVSIIPNSSDIDFFCDKEQSGKKFRQKHHWLGNRPLVVYCGTLGQVNGVDYLCKVAFETAKTNPEICFLVVGSGKMELEVCNEAKRLGVLNKNFFMLKEMKKIEIPAVLAAANFATSLVIDEPALWANSANKFFDALAAGIPFGINHEGWLAELLRSSGAGIVLSPRSHTEAAQQLIEKLYDKTWLENARKAAKNLAKNVFDRNLLAKKLEEELVLAAEYKQRKVATQ